MNSSNSYTLITGGSAGIGKAMAYECARRNMNLLLVALPGKELAEVAKDIEKNFSVQVHFLEKDLTDTGGHKDVYQWCRSNQYDVDILINNAGLAGSTYFLDSDIEYTDQRILLNIRTLVLLTRLFLPDLVKKKRAHILNVGSMSAFFPIPFKTIYSASKSFVVRFSTSLREELKHTGLRVSVVCPNGVKTNYATIARTDAHGAMGKLFMLDAEKVARVSIKKMLQGKRMIIPGASNYFLLFLGTIIPGGLKERILSREFRKEIIAGKAK